jgi:predicted Zn finger-like uncharacterized protein
MIIQCEKCAAKFRLDDARVTDKPVKVRCARCKHVFSVSRAPEAPAPHDDFGALLDRSSGMIPASPFEDTPASPVDQAMPEDASTADWFDTAAPGAGPRLPDLGAFDRHDADDGRQPAGEAMDGPADSEPFGDLGVFEFDEAPATLSDNAFPPRSSGATGAAAADSMFEIDEENPLAGLISPPDSHREEDESTAGDTPAFGFKPAEAAESPFEQPADSPLPVADDFSLDQGMFAEVTPTTTTAEQPLDPLGFDFQPDNAFTPPIAGEQASSPQSDGTARQESGPGETGMSDKEAVATPSPGASPCPPETVPMTHAPALPKPVAEEPPLPIPSRRRQSSLITAIVLFVAVILVAVLGYVGYSSLTEDKVASEATGRITVRNVDASFVKNSAAGDLLMITGEAVNEFAVPRAAIQVKGVVYGADGRQAAARNAFAGNLLTREQVSTMPMDKIEAAMANQFGDSLANLEVPPGKPIPFVIVIPGVPGDAREYGVQPAGSTVSTGKQP